MIQKGAGPTLLKGVIVVAAAACAAILPILWSQTAGVSTRDALIDRLLFSAAHPIDPKAYSPDVRIELERYLQRYAAYRSKRPRPVKLASEQGMVYTAWVAYERRLAAVSPDPRAPALAKEYVDRLRPCYEWEGFHGCPEREAIFATDYQTANPGGPFREYLPLLAAHRWLCAAEAYDYEKQPENAIRSRRAYETMVSTARQSKTLLIRLAAERLAERNRCLPQP
jgi:hypothetical protein